MPSRDAKKIKRWAQSLAYYVGRKGYYERFALDHSLLSKNPKKAFDQLNAWENNVIAVRKLIGGKALPFAVAAEWPSEDDPMDGAFGEVEPLLGELEIAFARRKKAVHQTRLVLPTFGRESSQSLY